MSLIYLTCEAPKLEKVEKSWENGEIEFENYSLLLIQAARPLDGATQTGAIKSWSYIKKVAAWRAKLLLSKEKEKERKFMTNKETIITIKNEKKSARYSFGLLAKSLRIWPSFETTARSLLVVVIREH